MSFQTIEGIVDRLIDWGQFRTPVEISWHAGEPLVVGIEYYRKAFASFRRLSDAGVQHRHSIQTNATLVTDGFCKLFREFKVLVGVSLDGPAWLHDGKRSFRGGRGSFAQAMTGVSRLREHDIGFYAIMVVTRDALRVAEEVYDFFRSNDVTFVGLNPEEREGDNCESSLTATNLDEYKDFLKSLFKRSLKDGAVVFREL